MALPSVPEAILGSSQAAENFISYYLFGRVPHTPVGLLTPVDMLNLIYGPAQTAMLLDEQGISGYRISARKVPLMLYDEFLHDDEELIGKYVFRGIRITTASGTELVRNMHDDLLAILQGMDKRIAQYDDFFANLPNAIPAPLREAAGVPPVDSRPAPDLPELNPESIAGIRGWLNLRGNQMDATFHQFLLDCRDAFQQRLEYLKKQRAKAQKLRDASAMSDLWDGEHALVRAQLRQQSGDVLRERNYFEAGWRGETPYALSMNDEKVD